MKTDYEIGWDLFLAGRADSACENDERATPLSPGVCVPGVPPVRSAQPAIHPPAEAGWFSGEFSTN